MVLQRVSLTTTKPDGFLTEERKSADDDHGFSTFFSETGTQLDDSNG